MTTFTPEYIPPQHIGEHARRLAELGVRLSMHSGPVLGGGLLTRAESGELPGKDVDIFFFSAEELAEAHAALLRAGLRVLRHNPRSGTAVLGSDTGPAYDLVLFPGGTPQRVLAKNDIRACGLVSDGVRAFALEGAIEDAEAHQIVLLRQTDPRRLQSYLRRGWHCPALDLREVDIALRGEAIHGLTSHDLTEAQRYGHEPVRVRLKDSIPALRVLDMTADILAARQLIELTPEYDRLAPHHPQPFQDEQIDAARDFIAQLQGGPRTEFLDIATMAFGTKKYGRWDRQRCDCRFGYGPRHGWVNMSIELRPEWRGRVQDLPADLVAAAVRVLDAMLDGRLPTDTLKEAR